MDKKIIVFSLLVSFLSLIIGFFPMPAEMFDILRVFTSYIFYSLGDPFKISEMEHSLTIALFFNISLFVSSILFYKTKGKETRVLRFIFSIIFINKCFFALEEICHIYVVYRDFGTFTFWHFLPLILSFGLLYFLYKSIKYINEQKVLEYEHLTDIEPEKMSYFKIGKWQRLLHFLIDNAIFVVLTFYFLDGIRMIYFNGSFGLFENILGRNTIWLMVVIFRFVFYFAFETLFSATPGKFLTESRVTNNLGLKTNNSFIFKRTLLRYIPFDSISFLLNANWHDSISHTRIYKEKRTGLKGKLFLLLIPMYLIIWLGIHLLGMKEEKDENYKYAFKRFINEKNQVLEGLRIIDTSTVLRLDDRNYNSTIKCLKVESIKNNFIEFSVLDLNEKNIKGYKLERSYKQSKNNLKKITVKRNDLKKMVLNVLEESPNYRESDKINFEGLSENSQLKGKNIEAVLRLYTPSLKVVTSDLKHNSIFVQLENRGVAGEITSVTFDDKNIVSQDMRLPEKFRTDDYIRLYAKGNNVKKYKMELIINDSLKRKFIYEISSTNDPTKVKLRLIE
jgi:uncharacterized RDD family membrane protein YckC